MDSYQRLSLKESKINSLHWGKAIQKSQKSNLWANSFYFQSSISEEVQVIRKYLSSIWVYNNILCLSSNILCIFMLDLFCSIKKGQIWNPFLRNRLWCEYFIRPLNISFILKCHVGRIDTIVCGKWIASYSSNYHPHLTCFHD